MWLQDNGDVLERGKQKHRVSGAEVEYEELWGDLDIDTIRRKQNRSSIALRADDREKNARGMIVKVGGWCQGIMKIGDKVTIERWQREPVPPTGNHARAQKTA